MKINEHQWKPMKINQKQTESNKKQMKINKNQTKHLWKSMKVNENPIKTNENIWKFCGYGASNEQKNFPK